MKLKIKTLSDYIAKTLISITLDINDDYFVWNDKYEEVFDSIANKDKEFDNSNKMMDLLQQIDLIDEKEIVN